MVDMPRRAGQSTDPVAQFIDAVSKPLPPGIAAPHEGAAPTYPGTMLEHGDTGAEVRAVQKQLNAELGGHDLKVDGQFGPATEAAVLRFQTAHGLATDGEVGPEDLRPPCSMVDMPRRRMAATDRATTASTGRIGSGMKWPDLQAHRRMGNRRLRRKQARTSLSRTAKPIIIFKVDGIKDPSSGETVHT